MTIDRRKLITAGAGMSVFSAAIAVASRPARAHRSAALKASSFDIAGDRGGAQQVLKVNLIAHDKRDQTSVLQQAIDQAAQSGVAVALPPGRFVVGNITLREGSILLGAHSKTTLEFAGRSSSLKAENADGIRIMNLNLDGMVYAKELILLRFCRDIILEDVTLRNTTGNAIDLKGCSGRISKCDVSNAGEAGIFSLDATGLEISSNRVFACANNGILVWRSNPAEDGTIVRDNRVFDISARAGGSGQFGNGINVFRANGVMVAGNRITDCAYSAVRANSASNIQIIDNACERIGEVALYAEFGFQGALISSNMVDTAACGISVTNFNEGGRLAVIQGNLIRNLFRRAHEPVDKRGEGIVVEADMTVSGNTIEGAATVGLAIGWGRFRRDIVANANVIRKCPVGIGISRHENAGACLVSQNLISGARKGAIMAMRDDQAVGPELMNDTSLLKRVTISGNVKA